MLTNQCYYINTEKRTPKSNPKNSERALLEEACIIFSAFAWYTFKYFLSLITIWLSNSLFFLLKVF